MSNTSKATIPVPRDVAAGNTPTETTSATNAEGLTAEDRAELIKRMLREALDESSPVAANLQMNGGDLLEMSLVLKNAIMQAAKSSGDVAELTELQSFIDTYVKVCRQADRVLRLKHEITNASHGTSSACSAKNPQRRE